MISPRDTAVSVLWNYAGKFADAAGFYIVGIIVAHSVGVREYSLYALALSGMRMVVALSAMGLEVALNKFIPGLARGGKTGAIRFLVQRVVVMRILLATVLSLGVLVLMDRTVTFAGMPFGLLGFSIFAIGRSVVPLLGMSMVAQLRTKIPSVIMTIVRIAEIALIGWLSYAGSSVQIYILALAGSSLAHAVALAVWLRPSLFGPADSLPLKPVLAFGGVFSINVVVDFVLSRYGDVMLMGVLVLDKAQVSLYEIGAGLVYAAGLVLTTGMAGVNLALFSEIADSGNDPFPRMRELYHAVVRVVSALTIPVLVFLLVDAASVIHVIYSDQFSGAAVIVQSLAAVRIAARLFGGGENTDALLALGKVGTVSGIGIASAVVNLVGDVLLLPVYGAIGAVVATSTAYLLVTLGTFLAVRKHLRVRLQTGPFVRFLAGPLVGAVAVLLMPQRSTLSALSIHLTLFVLSTVAVWMITKPLMPSDIILAQRTHRSVAMVLQVFSPRGGQ
ncbi:MAG: polysaccharide biosynthesis C-terminal domain-containing protein [Bacteroidota bacterium]